MNRLAQELFALDPEVVFLNHGSFGATPRPVLEARRAWEDRVEGQPVHYLWDRWTEDMEAVVARVARFVRADAEDLTLVDNATTGINAVLSGIDWQPGDRVVVLSHVYAAVHNTVQALADRFGLEVVTADVPFPLSDPHDAVDALDAVLAGARVAVIDHLTSITGLLLPLDDLLARCRAHGVYTLVDGAHAPGQVPLDLGRLDADVYVGNLHKWAFAPRGTALLWTRPGHPPLRPLVTSHGWKGSLQERFLWPGTRDFTGWLATPTALDLHESLGGRALMDRNTRLAAQAGTWLAERWGVALPAPARCRAALCAVPLPDGLPLPAGEPLQAARTLSRRLWHEARVEVPVLHFAGLTFVRLSIQVYNELHDVERLADAVDDLL